MFREKRPVEDDADLETDPEVEDHVHDDQRGEGELVGEGLRAARPVSVGAEDPEKADHGPHQAEEEERHDDAAREGLDQRPAALLLAELVVNEVDERRDQNADRCAPSGRDDPG